MTDPTANYLFRFVISYRIFRWLEFLLPENARQLVADAWYLKRHLRFDSAWYQKQFLVFDRQSIAPLTHFLKFINERYPERTRSFLRDAWSAIRTRECAEWESGELHGSDSFELLDSLVRKLDITKYPRSDRNSESGDSHQISSSASSSGIRSVLLTEFDEKFYLARYPFVSDSKIEPIDHFISQGWRQHLDPNPNFSTSFYLTSNPDVAAADINPLFHYLVAGRKEGRRAKPPGGFRYDILKNLSSIEDQLSDWNRNISEWDHAAEAVLEALREEIDRSKHAIAIAVSHDDASQNVGGTQLCILNEEKELVALGFCYVHLFPAQPLPILSNVSDLTKITLEVRCNGKYIGRILGSDLLYGLELFANHCSRHPFHLIVHALHGHSLEFLNKLYRRIGFASAHYWLHDHFSICPGYTLLRNGVTYCGAPKEGSQACQVCVFGEERQRHRQQIRRHFELVDYTIVAPSNFVRELWLEHANLPYKSIETRPHCEVHSPSDQPDMARSMAQICAQRPGPSLDNPNLPLRIAYLGVPAPHKGWPVFVDLTSRRANDERYKFHQFSAQNGGGPGTAFHYVHTTADSPLEMVHALKQNKIDAAFIWSIWPETFSFTAHEALSAGVAIITCGDSGNIARIVREHNCGVVFSNENEMFEAFDSGQIVDLLHTTRPEPLRNAKLTFSNMSASFFMEDAIQT